MKCLNAKAGRIGSENDYMIVVRQTRKPNCSFRTLAPFPKLQADVVTGNRYSLFQRSQRYSRWDTSVKNTIVAIGKQDSKSRNGPLLNMPSFIE